MYKKELTLALCVLAGASFGQQVGGDRDILPQNQTATGKEGQAHCPL